MNRLTFDSQLARSNETTWTLLKYTQLNGYRKQKFSPAIGTLFVTVNTARKYITVMSGITVLEEVGLIGYPVPIFKSRDKDVFIQTNTKEGCVLAKFRIKFVSNNDHANFIELVSHYVYVFMSSNDPSLSCNSQELFNQGAQRLEPRFTINDGRRRLADSSGPISAKRLKNEVSSEKLVQPLFYTVSQGLSQSNDQVVPSSADTSASTQTTLNETFPEESQVSFERRVSVADAGVQTEAQLSLESLLNDRCLLERVIQIKLGDPVFRTLVQKSKDILVDCFEKVSGGSSCLRTFSLQDQLSLPTLKSKSLKSDSIDFFALLEKYNG